MDTDEEIIYNLSPNGLIKVLEKELDRSIEQITFHKNKSDSIMKSIEKLKKN